MEEVLYRTVLWIAGGVNVLIALVLLYNNIWFSNYDVYRHARRLVALCYVVFAVGFALHAHFELRTTWPLGASALSVSYFHVGAVLFGWSHTMLMRPDYLTGRVVARDLMILFTGLVAYWVSVVCFGVTVFYVSLLLFFGHATLVTYIFYRTYHEVRRDLMRMPACDNARRWWTPEVKRTVLNGHHSFVIACHLIVLFGIGSMIVTAVFPTGLIPYTVLMMLGIMVYCYIFYAITEYGNVIDAATCATEDAEKKDPPPTPRPTPALPVREGEEG